MADQQSQPQSPDGTPMMRERAIELLKTNVKAWNEWRVENLGNDLPDLSMANLRKANLGGANLSMASLSMADLCGANLIDANFSGADLINANLSGASLIDANLIAAQLIGANLSGADLINANLSGASLIDANLIAAQLIGANLSGADLIGSNLSGAKLKAANLCLAKLNSSDFSNAIAINTQFSGLDLTNVVSLDAIIHAGPSSIGNDTLIMSRGQIPEAFLRGCGLQPWEIEAGKLYDPALTPKQMNDLMYSIFNARTGPLFLGGIFISYSHGDAKFVGKLYDRLMAEGANVWLDRHHMVAGDLEKQVDRAIRLNDVVILALSANSVDSDWVEHELEKARKKEKEEKRDVLCPVALDNAWEAKMNNVLWRQVKKKNVLDFSKWKTKAFEAPFKQLVNGLRINFPCDDSAATQS